MAPSEPHLPLTGQVLVGLEETKVERSLAAFPVLGWLLASWMWRCRAKPVRQRVDRLLSQRTRPHLTVGIQSVLDEICRIARAECGWTYPCFYPEDHLSVVFWGYLDGLDTIAAASACADAFGLRTETVEDLVFRGGTVQDLIDLALGRSKTPTP